MSIDKSTQFLQGYLEDLSGADACERKLGTFASEASHLMGSSNKDIHLWMPLLRVHPKWRRFAQKIGDCFVKGSQVLMAGGYYESIELVKIGDWVYAHDNRKYRVQDIIVKKFSGTLLTVGFSDDHQPITATTDHMVQRVGLNREPQWVAIGELNIGDKLLVPNCAQHKHKQQLKSMAVAIGSSARGLESKSSYLENEHGTTVDVVSLKATEVVDHTVYCLTVPGPNSFIINKIAVHNCVSWGAELAVTMDMAINDVVRGLMSFPGEAATEPIYGGCRVEALGKRFGGWSDGAFGYAAADWLSEAGGVILRDDYSKQTGIAAHNLLRYDGKKAKDWGNFGCGGQDDQGKLDAIAKKSPAAKCVRVKTIQEALSAIENGLLITIASMAGFGNMRRDANGVCRIVNQWAHQMMIGARRFFNGKPQFRCFQSWGDSCSGPDPGIEELVRIATGNDQLIVPVQSGVVDPFEWRRRLILPSLDFPYSVRPEDGWNPISACSWWIVEEDMARILKNGDCWAIGSVQGFEKKEIDWDNLSRW